MATKRNTGLTQRTAQYGFTDPIPADPTHLATLCNMRGVSWTAHARTFDTPVGERLTVWWLADDKTGAVTEVFEDTRGLN